MEKSIYTSYYAKHGGDPLSYAISASVPPYYNGKTYNALRPEWNMVDAFKKGNISEDQYAKLYIDLLEWRKITPERIIEDLPDGAILLCYEVAGQFCHRRVLAAWIELKTGIIVQEVADLPTEQSIFVDKILDF